MRSTIIVTVLAAVAGMAAPARAQGYYYNPYAAQVYAQQVYAQQMAAARYAAMRAAEIQREQEAMAAQAQMQDRMSEENQAAVAGSIEIQTHGWGRISARVNRVIAQLESWSGEQFTVVPTQTFNWGQAHANGVIYFDVSSAMQSESVLAFRLAHEWGHEALGHQPNIYNPMGRPRMIMSPTQDEDEADVYAGKFLCSNGYDIDEVEANLRRYPAITGDSHSSGEKRAQNVAEGCAAVRGVEDSIDRSSDDTSSDDTSSDDDSE